MTPRKPGRQRQQQKTGPTPLIQASDYESDAMNYQSDALPPASRTNTELNLAVLSRYIPNVRSVVTIAANAVLYSFNTTAANWEKVAIEGTFFVTSDYDLEIETGNETFTLMILNRRGLNNLVVEIGNLLDVEVTDDLLIVGMKGEEGEEERKVMGIWIHEDKDGIRKEISTKIKELWDKIMAVRESTQQGFAEKQPQGDTLTGRRLSLSEMFGRP